MDVAVATSDKQSLLSHCRNAHWSLLQRFAKAEIAIGETLGQNSPATFGAKLLRLPETQIDKAMRSRLTESRNLLAHAHIEIHHQDGEWLAYWSVSDRKAGLNARRFSRKTLDTWVKGVNADLDHLTKGA